MLNFEYLEMGKEIGRDIFSDLMYAFFSYTCYLRMGIIGREGWFYFCHHAGSISCMEIHVDSLVCIASLVCHLR